MKIEQQAHLRSPARVSFTEPALQKESKIKLRQEIALDRLSAFDAGMSPTPLEAGIASETNSWWHQGMDTSDLFWKIQLGEVGIVLGNKINSLPSQQDHLLPAPYGAGYVVKNETNPLTEKHEDGVRVVFKVDSGCEPW